MNENQFGTGAIKSPKDKRDFQWEKIGSASEPFDWSKGYETPVPLKIKDQNGSSSCGGQAISYIGEILNGIADGAQEEKSAKFIYAPIAVQGGGSYGRDLMARAKDAGWGSEALTPSYENGKPPSEQFMTRASDITPEAIESAKKERAYSYALITDNTNIDTIAQAIRDNKGALIGLDGENNGTWLTKFPKPPKNFTWRHWLFGCGAKMIDGVKYIKVYNSWGEIAGEKGAQWIEESYFTSGHCFEARTLVYNTAHPEPGFQHNFSVNLQRGMVGEEVIFLQKALRLEGLFTYPTNTGNYGIVTQDAVYKFQQKYNIAPLTRWIYKGFYCAEATRKKLNELYSP